MSIDNMGSTSANVNAFSPEASEIAPRLTVADTLKAAALDYVAAGWRIIPCQPGLKVPIYTATDSRAPAGMLPAHGTTGPKACSTVAHVEAVWSEYPEANLAWNPGSHGLVGYDFDPGARPGTYPPTRTVLIPRGRHLYFRGEGRSTNGRDHIDTRGDTGIMVLPPSVVDTERSKGSYSWRDPAGLDLVDHLDAADPPADLQSHLAKGASERRTAPSNVAYLPPSQGNINRTIAYLKTTAPVAISARAREVDGRPVPGRGRGDHIAFTVAAQVRGWGMPEEVAGDLMIEHWYPRCNPNNKPEFVRLKVANAYRYSQNDFGCDAAPGSEIFKDVVPAAAPTLAKDRRFARKDPLEAADRKQGTYWDDTELLPRRDGGCVGVIYGQKATFKTMTPLYLALRACFEREARVLWFAGEDPDGVGQERVPAACKAIGKTLYEHWPYDRTRDDANLSLHATS
jgi:hypothetical protein